jgi:hypothetical protein
MKSIQYKLYYIDCFKYLGTYVDEFFSFKTHSDHVIRKISVNAGLILKMRRYLNLHMLSLLINCHINSVIDYCLYIWGPSRVADFQKIQNLTNNLVASFFYPNLVKFRKKRFWCDLSSKDLVLAKKKM